jgi:hypothetical protein
MLLKNWLAVSTVSFYFLKIITLIGLIKMAAAVLKNKFDK